MMRVLCRFYSMSAAVRPHVPVISFPPRIAVELIWPPKSPATSQTPAAAATSGAVETKPIGSIPRGSGIEFHLLPVRYRRTALSEEEIQTINNGGAL
ncbi:uncharacterized protein LOC141906173 isoform X2 [Tubulanus polymorphus]|uniref:uncharacterized protein LOC141906173 isoform X2 n=1 Tax=Tubulanus polymorphus TaxID=672921 RepID=UPI003DA50ABD